MFDRINEGRWWDFGWQLVEGCTKLSPACENCWSLTKEKRFRKETGVIFHEERLERPLKIKKPTSFAIWNDLFHESVSFENIDRVIGVISDTPQHIYMVLTKRPERALEFFKWFGNEIKRIGFDSIPSQSSNPLDYYSPLSNLWIGITVEDQKRAYERIPILLDIPAKIKFLSCEPLLDSITIGFLDMCELNWVICGAETGNKARYMNPEWAKYLKDQCQTANIPFFMKKMSNNADITSDLMIRQLP